MNDTILTIRPAGAADVAALFDIRTSVRENHLSMAQLAELGITPDTLPAMLAHPGRGWLAERDGRALGFAMADTADATIFALFVRSEAEGQGIGRALLAEAEAWLFGQGCDTIWLATDRDRAVRANGFYRHLGWQDNDPYEDDQVRFIKQRP